MSTARDILESLKNIERLLAGMSIPVQSFQPGGKDWMLNATDEQIREHNRLKGIERKKRGRTGERQAAPTERRRRKV